MAADKDVCAMTQPAYPVACYPVAPPPRGEDLPYDDGVPMESERHIFQMMLLLECLKIAWANRQDFYAGGNMFVYFSELQSKKNDFRGPDVFVVLDTVNKERKSWVVWEENGRTPDVVIELTSPSTEHVDRGEKMRIYASILHVAEYYLFDPFELRLEGYELDAAAGEYHPMPRDERGWLHSRKLGLNLGIVRSSYMQRESDWLRWIGEDGVPLPTGQERADAQFDRAEGESERAQAEAERAQAEAERAQAACERADAAEQRLRQAARRLLDSGLSKEQAAATLGIDVSELDR